MTENSVNAGAVPRILRYVLIAIEDKSCISGGENWQLSSRKGDTYLIKISFWLYDPTFLLKLEDMVLHFNLKKRALKK